MIPDQARQLGLELRLVNGDGILTIFLVEVGIRAGHVLPDHQAELVAPVIPPVRLDLDVLADAVEAELLHGFDVPAQRLLGRRGVEAVRPESLVQRAGLEDELAVEQRAGNALPVLAQRDLAHAEVAGHRINGLAAGFQGHAEVIQMRRIGGPELGIRDGELEFRAGGAADLGDRLAAVAGDRLHRAGAFHRQP